MNIFMSSCVDEASKVHRAIRKLTNVDQVLVPVERVTTVRDEPNPDLIGLSYSYCNSGHTFGHFLSFTNTVSYYPCSHRRS